MEVRLSALRVGRPLPLERYSDIHFCYKRSKLQDSSEAGRIREIEEIQRLHRVSNPATFWLVA
jgi:hypothetical protein